MNIKDIILLIVTCVCLFLTYELITCNNLHEIQKKELNDKIKSYQTQSDSINELSLIYKDNYNKMTVKYTNDSLIADSLSGEINDAYVKIQESENKAKYYYNKYTQTNNLIVKLEQHSNYKNGNALLLSLKNKIN